MLKIDYRDKGDALIVLYDQLQHLNPQNEDLHSFRFLGGNFSVTKSQKDLCLAIADIEKEAEARALEYYSTRPDELADDLKDDIKFRVILYMCDEAFYELSPFLALLRAKAPDLHEQVMQFMKTEIKIST